MDESKIHILMGGYSLCPFSNDIPIFWPTGHKWVSANEANKATCEDCKHALSAHLKALSGSPTK